MLFSSPKSHPIHIWALISQLDSEQRRFQERCIRLTELFLPAVIVCSLFVLSVMIWLDPDQFVAHVRHLQTSTSRPIQLVLNALYMGN